MHPLHKVHLCVPHEQPYKIRGAHAICNGYVSNVRYVKIYCAVLFRSNRFGTITCETEVVFFM